MSKFSQIVKKQRSEKALLPEQTQIDMSVVADEGLSPVQRRLAHGAQHGMTFKRIAVDLIDLSPYQPRLVAVLNDHELQDLADNIRQYGQINPIIIRPKNGRYELIGGERRLRAVRDVLGLKDIDALIKDISDEKAALTALVDNINRADLSDYEIAYALTQTCERFAYPLDNIDFVMEKFSISRNKYYRLISLFDLPDFINNDLKKVPQALSGSGASLLKTALNRAVDQLGIQQALAILQVHWNDYFTTEFVKTQRRNSQFIKNFELQVQQKFLGQVQQINSIAQNRQQKKPDAINQNQLGLFNHQGKKIGSLKCSESVKGNTVLSIRMKVDAWDEEKLEKIRQFLETLEQ